MNTLFLLTNHLLPVILTLVVIVALLVWRVGKPYLHHILLVSEAKDETGIENLAHYLSHKAGGKRIHVGLVWQDFIPAAKGIRDLHEEKLRSLHADTN